MKILYFRPRDDEDPPPRPTRRRSLNRDSQVDADQAAQVVVLEAFVGSRSLPQAA